MPTSATPHDADSDAHALANGPMPESPRRGATAGLISAGVYSLGFAVQRAIGLVLLPFYTRAISPTQYGTLGVLLSVSAAASIVFSAGLDTSITRNYFQLASEPERRQEYIDSIWRFLVIYPVVGALVLTAAAWPFAEGLNSAGAIEVALMFVSAAFNTMAGTLPLNLLRARQDLRGYLWVTAVTTLSTPALTALFVVVLHLGVRGWFLAAGVASAATFLAALIVVPWRPRAKINWRVVGAALLFSAPLMPHFLSSWALQLADRLVIAGIVSGEQLGIYSLAANLATPMLLLVMALNQGFMPTYAKAGAHAASADELLRTVTLQISAAVTLTLAGAMFGSTAVRLLASPAYHGAAPLVPWIVLGYGFLGVYFVPMNGATLGAGRRNFAWVATASSAAVNIGLLVALVPRYGIHAAAVASAVGYFLLLILMAVWAHARDNPVRYDWRRIGRVLALGLVAYAGSATTLPAGAIDALAVQAIWLACFVATVALMVFRAQTMRLVLKR